MENQEQVIPEDPEVLKQSHLTITQFADLFGVTRQCIYNMVNRKDLDVVRFGSVILIPRREVRKYKPVFKEKILRLEKR